MGAALERYPIKGLSPQAERRVAVTVEAARRQVPQGDLEQRTLHAEGDVAMPRPSGDGSRVVVNRLTEAAA